MYRYEYEERVLASNLNQTAKLVLLSYTHHSDKQLKEVSPSYSRVAAFAGVTREVAREYADELVAQGWLVPTRVGKNNVQHYTFGTEVVEPFGNLVKKKRRVAVESIDNLKRLPKKQVVDTDSQVVDSSDSRLSIETPQVVEPIDTNYKEQLLSTELEEELEETTTPPAAGGDDASPSFNEEEVRATFSKIVNEEGLLIERETMNHLDYLDWGIESDDSPSQLVEETVLEEEKDALELKMDEYENAAKCGRNYDPAYYLAWRKAARYAHDELGYHVLRACGYAYENAEVSA